MGLLIWVVNLIFTVYRWMLLARIIISWIPNIDFYHPVVRFLYRTTEPVLQPFRRLIPPISGIDLSPILAFFVIDLVRGIIVRILAYL